MQNASALFPSPCRAMPCMLRGESNKKKKKKKSTKARGEQNGKKEKGSGALVPVQSPSQVSRSLHQLLVLVLLHLQFPLSLDADELHGIPVIVSLLSVLGPVEVAVAHALEKRLAHTCGAQGVLDGGLRRGRRRGDCGGGFRGWDADHGRCRGGVVLDAVWGGAFGDGDCGAERLFWFRGSSGVCLVGMGCRGVSGQVAVDGEGWRWGRHKGPQLGDHFLDGPCGSGCAIEMLDALGVGGGFFDNLPV